MGDYTYDEAGNLVLLAPKELSEKEKRELEEDEERCIRLSNELLDELFADEGLIDYAIIAARFFAIQHYGDKSISVDSRANVALLLARPEGKEYTHYAALSFLMQAEVDKLTFGNVMTSVFQFLNIAYTSEGGYLFLERVKEVATESEGMDCRTDDPSVAFPILLTKRAPQASTSKGELIIAKDHLKQFTESDFLNLEGFNNFASLCSGDNDVYKFVDKKHGAVLKAFIREFCYISACALEKQQRKREEQESQKFSNCVKRFISNAATTIGLTSTQKPGMVILPPLTMVGKSVVPETQANVTEIKEDRSPIHERPSEVLEDQPVAGTSGDTSVSGQPSASQTIVEKAEDAGERLGSSSPALRKIASAPVVDNRHGDGKSANHDPRIGRLWRLYTLFKISTIFSAAQRQNGPQHSVSSHSILTKNVRTESMITKSMEILSDYYSQQAEHRGKNGEVNQLGHFIRTSSVFRNTSHYNTFCCLAGVAIIALVFCCSCEGAYVSTKITGYGAALDVCKVIKYVISQAAPTP